MYFFGGVGFPSEGMLVLTFASLVTMFLRRLKIGEPRDNIQSDPAM